MKRSSFSHLALFTLAACLALACLPVIGCGDGSNSIGDGLAESVGSDASAVVVVHADRLDDGHFEIARSIALSFGVVDDVDAGSVEIMCVPARQGIDGPNAWDCGVFVMQPDGTERTGPHAFVRFESSPDPRIDSRHRTCDDENEPDDVPESAALTSPLTSPRYLATITSNGGFDHDATG